MSFTFNNIIDFIADSSDTTEKQSDNYFSILYENDIPQAQHHNIEVTAHGLGQISTLLTMSHYFLQAAYNDGLINEHDILPESFATHDLSDEIDFTYNLEHNKKLVFQECTQQTLRNLRSLYAQQEEQLDVTIPIKILTIADRLMTRLYSENSKELLEPLEMRAVFDVACDLNFEMQKTEDPVSMLVLKCKNGPVKEYFTTNTFSLTAEDHDLPMDTNSIETADWARSLSPVPLKKHLPVDSFASSEEQEWAKSLSSKSTFIEINLPKYRNDN